MDFPKPAAEGDPGLERAVQWFKVQPDMRSRFGAAIRRSFDEVFDGQRTGRYRLEELGKVEKTYIGTKVEIVVQAEFGLQRGRRMDYLVAGEDIDAKWSMKSGGWMIPTEAVQELCLCLTADDNASTFSVGVLRATEERLRASRNKDSKRRFTNEAVAEMTWLAESAELPENLLLHLDDTVRDSILDPNKSGQRAVNELFRRVQGRVVDREVVLTVAQQQDGPKRVRDARRALAAEGVVILGHQSAHPAIAEALGVPVPRKGSWVSAVVVEADSGSQGAFEASERWWRLAEPSDVPGPGPRSY